MGYGVDQATPLLLLMSYHVLLMASMSPATASPLCFSNQSSALLRFKQGLVLYQQHSYDPLSSWQIGTDCCKWEGITCDDNNLTGGFVTALQINDVTRKYSSSSTIDTSLFELRHLRILFLSRIGFEGFELARLVELTHLTHLGLSVNLLSGQIPPEISQMTSLVSLDLSGNQLSGQIPPEISQMTSLVSLDLGWNQLSGQIPPEISQMTSLVYLNLGWNHLSGHIPPEISQMTSLVSLYLSHNDGLRLQHPSFAEFVKRLGHLQHLHLDGVNISTSTGKEVSLATSSFLPNLQTLVLNNCSIHGPMHESILRLRSLSLLDLRINNLGYLPDFFSNFTSLQQLLLGDAQLKGKFPWGILQLPQLKRLALSQNPHLIVSLPPLRVIPESSNLEELDLSSVKVLSTNSLLEFSSKLSHLNTLDLSACGLNGMIPSSWASPNISLVTLNNNNLSGPIPETWSKLSNLYFLDLSNNLLSGSIPPGLLNNHPSLGRLNLANNRLNGSLFHFYAHFSNLMSLNIYNNLLSGEIPSSISRLSNLVSLTLSSNNLIGSIPTSICSCSWLSLLDLSNNSLAGTIPSCLTRLSVLTLGRNQLQGSIPDGFSYLKVLQLNDNLLVGKIPRSLYNCSSLKLLDMGNNKLEDTFPSWMGNLTKLKVLVLHSNRLYGSITSFDLEGAFPLVQIFDIADNRFSGVLPSTLFKSFKAMMVNNEIGNGNLDIFIGSYGFGMYSGSSSYAPNVMLTIKGSNMLEPYIIAGLTTIDLSSNRFTGEIPEEIGALAWLRVLNMSHNHLKGPIPKSLGNLLQMESLDLSHNQLTGGIPQEMTKLTFLSILNLSFNNLQGSIPREGQFSTFDDTCFEGNPELCGTLSRPCRVSSAGDTPLIVGNEKNDQEPEWEYMAPGLGFVVGLAATILPILFSKRMGNWYWDLVDKVLASLLPRH